MAYCQCNGYTIEADSSLGITGCPDGCQYVGDGYNPLMGWGLGNSSRAGGGVADGGNSPFGAAFGAGVGDFLKDFKNLINGLIDKAEDWICDLISSMTGMDLCDGEICEELKEKGFDACKWVKIIVWVLIIVLALVLLFGATEILSLLWQPAKSIISIIKK